MRSTKLQIVWLVGAAILSLTGLVRAEPPRTVAEASDYQATSSYAQVMEFCAHGTKLDCQKMKDSGEPCTKLHFKKIIQKHTDESLGDCSFLNTCFHMDTCKYV